MGYRVPYRGVDVYCETPQDVDALVEHEARDSQRLKKQASARHGSVRRLVKESGAKQQQLLTWLLGSPEPRSDEELRAALDLEDNKALAGILAGISKRAKTAGIESDLLVKSTRRNGAGERHYHYNVNPELVEEVKAALGIKEKQ